MSKNINQIKRVLDVEIYEEYGNGHWAQARFLVHGLCDVLWTNSIEEVVNFLESDLTK